MKRREFLGTAIGAAGAALLGSDACARKTSLSPAVARTVASTSPAGRSAVDLDFVLRAAADSVSLLQGQLTQVWRFSANVLRGPIGAIAPNGSGYLGPTLRVKRGQRVRVHFDNAITEDTIVHWHGLHVSEQNDGHPSYAIPSANRYVYDFEVENRAGTYWYHAHPADRTGPQVYLGLAGLLLVYDDDEQRLGLPDGDRELMLVLQDRTFDESNQLVYAPNRMIGFLGDRVLVNGQLSEIKEVQRGPYRLRILNGSNSRIYDLAWSDGSALTVLGTDGGLLDAPRNRAHVVLAPGQRLDVWANFGAGPGDDVWLESRAFESPAPSMGMFRMGGGSASGIANGAAFRIQRFVSSGNAVSARPPEKLVSGAGPVERAVSGPTKTFAVGMRMMRWLFNGRDFEMRGVADDERVRLGTVEDWEFVNASGRMSMAHPIHLHGSQFRIVERRPASGEGALRDGILDEGWQDTFLLLPGDAVRIRVGFERHAGLFLYHCHNLEHEDMGMMRNYLVTAAS